MTDQQPACPKCGAEKAVILFKGKDTWECGTALLWHGEFFISRRCLRDQLAAVTEERDELLAYRTANKIRIRELNGLLGNEVAENTRLLGVLDKWLSVGAMVLYGETEQKNKVALLT